MICSLHTHVSDAISKIKYNSEPYRTSHVFSEDSRHLSQQDLPGEEEHFRSWKTHDVLSIFVLLHFPHPAHIWSQRAKWLLLHSFYVVQIFTLYAPNIHRSIKSEIRLFFNHEGISGLFSSVLQACGLPEVPENGIIIKVNWIHLVMFV